MQRESSFQANLIHEIKERFSGSIVIKNDAGYIQGLPDLIVLYGKHWAALECKRSGRAGHRPNQQWYVDLMNEMSFAAFVYPENKEEVLNGMEQAFES